MVVHLGGRHDVKDFIIDMDDTAESRKTDVFGNGMSNNNVIARLFRNNSGSELTDI